jgi:hypothetical protein
VLDVLEFIISEILLVKKQELKKKETTSLFFRSLKNLLLNPIEGFFSF